MFRKKFITQCFIHIHSKKNYFQHVQNFFKIYFDILPLGKRTNFLSFIKAFQAPISNK